MESPLSLLVTLALLSTALIIGAAAQDEASGNSTASPWLDKIHRRRRGCRFRPWICRDRLHPFRRRLCCRNRCVDVGSDTNNCGSCGIRCPFHWQCCGGCCVDTTVNPLHCGDCDTRCPFESFCSFGLCGYAEPFPFPLPPVGPWPPSPYSLPARRPASSVVESPENPMIGSPALD